MVEVDKLRTLEHGGLNDLAIEAGSRAISDCRVYILLRTILQVYDVDCSVGLLREVVCQQTKVGECPAKDIVDEEDGGVLVSAGDVSYRNKSDLHVRCVVDAGTLVLAKRGLLARWLSLPVECVSLRRCNSLVRLGGGTNQLNPVTQHSDMIVIVFVYEVDV